VIQDGANAPAALSLRGIHKRFGSVVALANVDLEVRPGTVHAVLGENGAGKSTLMQVAYGTLLADSGDVHPTDPAARAGRPRRGVGMVHQHLSLVPAMTALENFQLGASGRFDRADARRRLESLAAESGLRVDPDRTVGDMTLVQQQRLEILKALGRDASVLILDEPTAVLAPPEARDLLAWIRAFASNGRSVVLVTHKLREALGIADEITVLRRGVVTWRGLARDTSEADLARAVFPDVASTDQPSAPRLPPGDAVVRANGLVIRGEGRRGGISRASFSIKSGEIIGIAAIEGSGQHELLLALAGRVSVDGGTLDLPAEIAFVPADRKRDAVIPAFSLAENVALRNAGRRRGRMPWREISARTAGLIERFAITAPGPATPLNALSGGNQQRLVVARELEHRPALVVADNPTRGLDLQATAFVHSELRSCAEQGSAVVLHSSDLDEILALATRILVVFDGQVSETALDREVIGRAMLGAA
jgi:ABC-type uncharacterized transport system ATPase subunit